MKNDLDMRLIIKSFIAFFVLIPVIIVGVSYLPFMMSDFDRTASDFFIKNVLYNLGLKVIIATFLSGLLTIFGTFWFNATKIGKTKK